VHSPPPPPPPHARTRARARARPHTQHCDLKNLLVKGKFINYIY